MADPIIQFVDQPTTSANLRYDFNTKTATVQTLPLTGEGLDLGNPSFDGEPEGVGGRYGYRPLRLTQRIIGSRANALARMQVLSRELLRNDNWLRFQQDPAATPVYFHTYRTEPGGMSMEWSNTANAWDVSVPLVADPFAYGPRVTISSATVNQAPSGSNPMRLVLPAIKGDAPTPLRVTLTPSAASSANNALIQSRWLLGCVAGSVSMTDSVVDIGTGDTVNNINGTAAPTTDASYFGGSYRTVTIGAATPNLLDRFKLTLPTTLQPGRYKALLRSRYTAAAAQTLLFQLSQMPDGISGSIFVRGRTTTLDVGSGDTGRDFWVDLGEITLPFGINPPSDGGGTMPGSALAVAIGTSSGGSSSVNVDSIKLIPIDGTTVTRTTLLKTYSRSASSGALIFANVAATFDGDLEAYWNRTTAGTAYNEATPELSGYFPIADPAAEQNLLLLMALDSGLNSASATNYITKLNASTTVDASYYPRFLYVGDGT